MAEEKKETAVEKAAAREKLEKYWLGKYRYSSKIDGVWTQVPDYLYTEWYLPEDTKREVCIELDDNNKPVWMDKPNAPAPPTTFDGMTKNESQHDLNPAAAQPSFDYIPPAYNSDTQSGGPSNFDGQAGGDENPRNPALEGERENHYADELAQYKERLEALEAALKEATAEPASGVDALKEKINGKSK